MSNTIINTNVSALNSHRAIISTGSRQQRSSERLSTGMRINRAADDAAGLAISEKMRNQIRGLDQATRNSQDGISLVQTAEGALEEMHRMLERTRQLINQASTGSNTEDDRRNILVEVTQLMAEIDQTVNNTEFNTMNLLGGSGLTHQQQDILRAAEAFTAQKQGELDTAIVNQRNAQNNFDAQNSALTAARANLDALVRAAVAYSANPDQHNTSGNIPTAMENALVVAMNEFRQAFAEVGVGPGGNVYDLGILAPPPQISDSAQQALNTARSIMVAIVDDLEDLHALSTGNFNTDDLDANILLLEEQRDILAGLGINVTDLNTRIAELKDISYDIDGEAYDDSAAMARLGSPAAAGPPPTLATGAFLVAERISTALDGIGPVRITQAELTRYQSEMDDILNNIDAELVALRTTSTGTFDTADLDNYIEELQEIRDRLYSFGVDVADIDRHIEKLEHMSALVDGSSYDDSTAIEALGVAAAVGPPSTPPTGGSLHSANIRAAVTALTLPPDTPDRGGYINDIIDGINNGTITNTHGVINFGTSGTQAIEGDNRFGFFGPAYNLHNINQDLNVSRIERDAARQSEAATLRIASSLELQVQSGANASQRTDFSIDNMSVRSLGLANLVSDFTEALSGDDGIGGVELSSMLNKLDDAINIVSVQRSELGAIQNRLEHTINNLRVASENMSAANSRIRDTDMAQEMMMLTQSNVLQQAGMSMLAQANQAPQNVLQLLG